ncbi:hypothetical protein JAAARDRAFT_39619 [Jaapia argillacea MUCL 33604]|uniref:DUF6533 domain-containing protein n=1 Tax=Jaapia argillacea MUCL 33604 TaxID=933084 RepID=A0A067PSD8_9AGAM|nr:hypothetical protein JAAARDRAFT_39619 [Jaapia argillacea MUCL 33604]
MADSSHLAKAILERQQVNYCSLSSLAFLIWDVCITFGDEVNYIWRYDFSAIRSASSSPGLDFTRQSNQSPTKWLFLFTRYVSVVGQMIRFLLSFGFFWTPPMPRSICHPWFIVQSLWTALLITAVELIFGLRVYAVYQSSRWIRNLLLLVFACNFLVVIITFAVMLPKFQYNDDCFPLTTANTLEALRIWTVTPVSVQTILMLLTLIKAIPSMRKSIHKTPLILVVARDGTWAYFLISVFILYDGIFYNFLSLLPRTLILSWFMTVISFSSCRLILNIAKLRDRESTADRDHEYFPEFTSDLQVGQELHEMESTVNREGTSACPRSPSGVWRDIEEVSPSPH